MGDMSPRAVATLREADLVLAEDTRTSGKLMHHFGIDTPMQSHHMFNEHRTAEAFVERIQAGQNIALITDAGTPGISDPGFLIARQAIRQGVEVECLPGPGSQRAALRTFCVRGLFAGEKRPRHPLGRAQGRGAHDGVLRGSPQIAAHLGRPRRSIRPTAGSVREPRDQQTVRGTLPGDPGTGAGAFLPAGAQRRIRTGGSGRRPFERGKKKKNK